MKSKSQSYQKRVISFTLIVVVLTVLIGHLLELGFMNSFYYNRKKVELLRIRESVIKIREGEDRDNKLSEYLNSMRDSGVQVHLILPGNELENQQGKNLVSSLYDLPNGEFTTIELNQIRNTVLVYRETFEDGYTLFLRTSLSVVNNYKAEMGIFNIVTAILSIIIASLLGVIFSKRITDDIERLNERTKKIASLEMLKKSIQLDDMEIDREDEIGELSKNINLMGKNLYEAIESLELFVGNASHELKTPISVLSATLESLAVSKEMPYLERRKRYNMMIRELRTLQDLLEDLLLLSKIRLYGYNLDKSPVNVSWLLKESVKKFENLELERDITFDIKVENQEIYGDRKLLKIAFDNIVSNALKYATFGSEIDIYIENQYLVFRNSVDVRIENSEELLTPFVRGVGEESKIQGTGLGLAIVKRALEGNEIEFEIVTTSEDFEFKLKIT